MTWDTSNSIVSSPWINSSDSYDFKREYMCLFDLPKDIKKEAKPPPKQVYFDPEELVL